MPVPEQTERTDKSGEAETPEATDTELIVASQGGDRAAFAELWERHRRAAHTTAFRIDRSNAEDVVSEAFVAIWEQLLRGGGPRESFRAYALTTVRRLAVLGLRAHSHEISGVDWDGVHMEGATGPSSDEIYELEADGRAVLAAFGELPDHYRRVLWLRDVEGLSQKEAAARLELSQNAAALIAMRAREGLATAWLGQHLSEGDGECKTCVGLLPRYVRGTLRTRASVKVERHLAVCSHCQMKLSQLREVNSGLAQRMVVAFALVSGGVTTATIGAAGDASAAEWTRVFDGIGEGHRSAALAVLGGGASRAAARTAKLLAPVALLLALFVAGAVLLNLPGRDETTPAAGLSGAGEPPGKPVTSPSPSAEGLVDSSDPPRAEEGGDDDGADGDADLPAGRDGGHTEDGVHSGESGESDLRPGETYDRRNADDRADGEPVAGVLPPTAVTGGRPGVAPRLTGSAEPGALVSVWASGAERTVRADRAGGWTVDLAELPLAFGAHAARVSQTVEGVRSGETRVTFDLRRARYVAQERVPSPGAGAAVIDVTLTGEPGAIVCLGGVGAAEPSAWAEVPLSEQGRGETVLAVPEGWSKHDVSYWYCDGSRTGPASGLTLDFWWHSSP